MNKKLYFYKKGYICIKENNYFVKQIQIYRNTIKEITRISARLFRTEPKYAVPLNEKNMLLVGRRRILLVDIEKKTFVEVATSRKGFSDPLNVCVCNEKWCAVWGDYGSNTNYEKINVYGLTKDWKIEVIYSFQEGKVRHIHNIIPKISGGYYIFTGDQESDAGIYYADSTFSSVLPLKIGMQKYRAVVGFDTINGLLYATDSVNETNYIYLLNKEGELKKICKLNGSCIYGTEINGKYFFSTIVEPDENNKGLIAWISTKRGKGILSNNVCLVSVDEQMDFKEVLKFEKDRFPIKLMQYGAIQFPKGKSEELWIYPIAVKRYDGSAIKVEARL